MLIASSPTQGMLCSVILVEMWQLVWPMYTSPHHHMSRGSIYEGWLISNAHSEIFCQRSKEAMRAQCVLVATILLHSGAKFHSFLYTHSKTVRVNMESCYGGMSKRLQ